MTPALKKQIETLESRMQLLVYAKREAEARLADARQENERLEAALSAQKQRLDDFKYKHKIANIASQLSEQSDVSELKEKIDEYIREVDHCIAFLSKEL